jgi:DMSO/TMAO reductase YedYZ heme-binding membrane subunit
VLKEIGLLHRLVYAAAAVIHVSWKVKVFTADPVIYTAVLGGLLGFRIVWALKSSRPRVN